MQDDYDITPPMPLPVAYLGNVSVSEAGGSCGIGEEIARLREMSGLEPVRLAQDIFRVTRQAFHRWQTGFVTTTAHREHTLEVLAVIEEAYERLGSPSRVATWLLTPLSPGGKKPIEYLRDKKYTAFRGALLRTMGDRTRTRTVVAAKLPVRPLPKDHREGMRRRARPRSLVVEGERD